MTKKGKAFTKDISKKSTVELQDMLEKMQKDLFFMRMKNKVRALKQTHELKTIRRNIARIKTFLVTKQQ